MRFEDGDRQNWMSLKTDGTESGALTLLIVVLVIVALCIVGCNALQKYFRDRFGGRRREQLRRQRLGLALGEQRAVVH